MSLNKVGEAIDLGEFVRSQRLKLPVLATAENSAGRTFIVTGSNNGIGLEAAKHWANLGAAKVILAVRSKERGEAAKARIDKETGCAAGVVEVWIVDMASYASIREFAQRASSQLERIDAAVLNATCALDRYTESEGLESHLTVNVTGTTLLSVLLLPKLTSSAKRFGTQPHLVIVTSGMGFSQKATLDAVKTEDILEGLSEDKTVITDNRYSYSKLLQMYSIRQLASLVPVSKSGVVINILNPGLCNTGLARYSRSSFRLQVWLLNVFLGRTPEEGSRTILHGAVAGEESHGKYVSECAVRDNLCPSWMSDEDGRKMQQRVWDNVAARLEKAEPGCLAKIM